MKKYKKFTLNGRDYQIDPIKRFMGIGAKSFRVTMRNNTGLHVLYFPSEATIQDIESGFKNELGQNF